MKDTTKENWGSFWEDNKNSRFTEKSWSKIRMMKLLDKLIDDSCEILDAGCGSGFFSNYFIEKGCRVSSLDFSEEALGIAKKITQGRSSDYIKGDLLDPSLANKYENKFDIIFSDGLFEHFSGADQKKIMNNFRKMKKPGGIITTFVPNRFSWWQIARPIFMPGIKEKPFTLKELEKLHYNMNIIKKGGISVFPFKISPEELLGKRVGMILYCFAK